ncbi:MAG TPA: hypothetical protein VHP11_15505, partial [Tepidisphaeraceae bacterium]|nr:hypothetical protein [Tepidisphaeraceae bacterium]
MILSVGASFVALLVGFICGITVALIRGGENGTWLFFWLLFPVPGAAEVVFGERMAGQDSFFIMAVGMTV